MSKKCWSVCAVAFALAAAFGLAIPLLLPPTPGVSYRNYSRIEKGMTQKEVESILGSPSTTRPELIIGEGLGETRRLNICWDNDQDDIVWVEFDQDRRVKDTTFNGWPESRNGWQKLMDRLPWFAKDPPPRPITANTL